MTITAKRLKELYVDDVFYRDIQALVVGDYDTTDMRHRYIACRVLMLSSVSINGCGAS